MKNGNLIETLSLAPVFIGCERNTLEELAGSAGHRLRHKEEMMLFPYIIALQETINQGLEAQPFHCGSVQYPCRQMMMEHDGELERYDRILGICKTFTEPFASSEECSQMVSCIEVFLQKLQEHIYLENENLFPRAIQAEGLEEVMA